MIELKATGKCVGCPACDPEFSKLFSFDIPIEPMVFCRNSAICEHLEKYIADKLSAPCQTDKYREAAE